jgi:predicted aspartyl protease/tetratricopeptide (TPR) repeat protein
MNRSTGNVWVQIGAAIAACALAPHLAFAGDKKCTIGKAAELPITMNSLRPTIAATINGREAKFLVDSGAFWSMMSTAAAAEYGLKAHPFHEMRVKGVGGSAEVEVTSIKEFGFAGISLKNVDFLVGGSEAGATGLVGQNLLEKFDVEYDLAHGAIRLFVTENCDHAQMAYWLTGDQPYSELPIERISAASPHTVGAAYVNGQKIRVYFDTGAFNSLLSLQAAARAGVKPDSPGVVATGFSGGIGSGMVKSYIGSFTSFKIGDTEEIKNTKLRFADTPLLDGDMLLGADFFISHRIFVANKEHKLFLTYNGGPVFNLRAGALAPTTTASTTTGAGSDAASGDAAGPADTTAQAADAAAPAPAPNADELAREGAALAARRDFAAAVANLSKAIALDPDKSEYYLERGNAYWAGGHGDLALPDFDRAVELKPDSTETRLRRAEFEFGKKDEAAAFADLDAIDRLLAPQADSRLTLAQLYEGHNRMAEAVAQYTLWIASHPVDYRMATALAQRCVSRALLNQDLSAALGDCNTSLRRVQKGDPAYSGWYVDRALVRLRLGDYDKAIGDANDALKLKPANSSALFVRGIAEARKNQAAASAADLAEATRISPQVADKFARFGIVP